MGNNLYDLVMMVTPNSFPLCKRTVEYVYKNIKPKRIVLIGNRKVKDLVGSDCVFVDEDELLDGLSFANVKKILLDRIGDAQRTGWYLQQFLKMGYALKCDDAAYMVWDSDTIPLNEIDYFSNNKYKFFTKTEYHKPYFETINKILDNNVSRWNKDVSFISENMIFSVPIMRSLINDIQTYVQNGGAFWEKILYSIDLKDIGWSGFSEFETYGNYVMKYFPEVYELHKIKSLRNGCRYFGNEPSDEVLFWISNEFQTISFEQWDNPKNMFLIKKVNIIMKFLNARQYMRLVRLSR